MAIRKKATRKIASKNASRDELSRTRDNRILAQYLMVQCWLHQLDCIVLERQDLLHFFEIKTVHRTQSTIGFHDLVDEFKYDLSSWFPYLFGINPYYGIRPNAEGYCDPPPVDSLWLSRLPRGDIAKGKLSTEKRMEQLCVSGIETDLLSEILPNGKIPPVDDMLGELTLIATGVEDPTIKKARVKKRKQRNG